ncbi:hypothetical protein AVEN_26093-1, partial [Araneus ventricosus]
DEEYEQEEYQDEEHEKIPHEKCIESVGAEVMAKCVYATGNVPAYKKYGRLRDLFKMEGNKTLA